jgi:hypothetical protein
MRSFLFCALILSLATGVHGEATESAEGLVRKLGDSDPGTREQAAAALRKLGKPAVPALEAGLESNDPEVRRGSAEVLEDIHEDRGPRINAFLAGTDPVQDPMPGWATFKEVAGKDRMARVVYLELATSNPTFVEKLQKDPKAIASQAANLCSQFWSQQGPIRPLNQSRSEQLLIALLAASLESNLNPNTFNNFNTLLYQPEVRRLLPGNPVCRRLVTRILTARATDPNLLVQTAYVATNLELTDYIESHLIPATQKLIEGLGDNPQDPNRLGQIIQLAQAARLSVHLRTKLMPVVHKLAEVAAKTVKDGSVFNNPNAMYQASSACQTLGMKDVTEGILRPAVREMIRKVADKPDDTNHLYQAINLARNVGLDDELKHILQPVVCKMCAEAARHPEDENRLNITHNLARQLNLNEAIEGALRPAMRKHILAALEQPEDFNRFTQAVYQARNFELTDLLEDTLKPLFARQAAALVEHPDFNRIQQFYYLSQNLGANNAVEDNIKPAFRKHLKEMEAKAALDPRWNELFSLAKQMGLAKEVLPMARRAALAKDAPGYARGMAILLVIDLGDKDDLAALEPLLTDTTAIGTMGLNQSTLTAQVRDVVLGGLVTKAGKAPADFGFPYYKVAPQVRVFDMPPTFLGFGSAEERTAAFKKWEQTKAGEKTPEGRP